MQIEVKVRVADNGFVAEYYNHKEYGYCSIIGTDLDVLLEDVKFIILREMEDASARS